MARRRSREHNSWVRSRFEMLRLPRARRGRARRALRRGARAPVGVVLRRGQPPPADGGHAAGAAGGVPADDAVDHVR